MPVRIKSAYEIEELTAIGDLESLRPEWTSLWARNGEATPFQSPQWLIAWWNHFHPGELWTLAVRRGGRLVGLFPAWLHVGNDSPRRTLLLLGTANSDYLDGLFEPGDRQAVAAVYSHLADNHHRWDVCDLQNLRKSSPLLSRSAELPDGFRSEVTVQDTCPVLRLPSRLEELPGGSGQSQWKKVDYYQRRAAKEGLLRVDRADEASLHTTLEELIRLHAVRWNEQGLPGVVADRAVQDFHREVAPQMLRSGLLRLYAFRIGERLAAVLYALAHRGQTCYYLSGFDPEFRKLSPGLLIVAHAIREAVAEQAQRFDFLRGCESYKYAWGALDCPIFRRRIVQANHHAWARQ